MNIKLRAKTNDNIIRENFLKDKTCEFSEKQSKIQKKENK